MSENIVRQVKEKARRGEEITQEETVKVFEAVKNAFKEAYNIK